MLRPAFWKSILVIVVVFASASAPKIVLARRGSGSDSGGSSHGAGSRGGGWHGDGGFHGGGRSSFHGGGQSIFRGSRGGGGMSFRRSGGGSFNTGRINRGSFPTAGGFSSHAAGNFSRSSGFGRGNFGPTLNARGFDSSRGWQAPKRNSRNFTGGWQSFGKSNFRAAPEFARLSGNTFNHASANPMGGRWQSFGNSGFRAASAQPRFSGSSSSGWRPFGNVGGAGRIEMSRGYGSFARNGGEWHSFGNPRNENFVRNAAGVSFAGAGRGYNWAAPSSRWRFGADRFSSHGFAATRFSSFPSYSSRRTFGDFGSERFGGPSFANAGFGSSGYGGSEFGDSLFGSALSLIPNLLFGGLLRFGGSLLGGGGLLEGGLLAGNAISLAARWLGSASDSNDFGFGGPASVDFGFGQGFGVSFGYTPVPAPLWPACTTVPSFQWPAWGWNTYCGYTPHYFGPAWNGNNGFGVSAAN
jgi:hypothetical protein